MANGFSGVSNTPEVRSGYNSTGSTIPKGTAVKLDGTNYRGITPVTAVNDVVYGVTAEDIKTLQWGAVTIRGSALVLAAGTLTLGRVGVDTTGKATNTCAVGSAVLGITLEVGAASALVEVELLGPGAFN